MPHQSSVPVRSPLIEQHCHQNAASSPPPFCFKFNCFAYVLIMPSTEWWEPLSKFRALSSTEWGTRSQLIWQFGQLHEWATIGLVGALCECNYFMECSVNASFMTAIEVQSAIEIGSIAQNARVEDGGWSELRRRFPRRNLQVSPRNDKLLWFDGMLSENIPFFFLIS